MSQGEAGHLDILGCSLPWKRAAFIQRCQVHQIRNILAYVSETPLPSTTHSLLLFCSDTLSSNDSPLGGKKNFPERITRSG